MDDNGTQLRVFSSNNSDNMVPCYSLKNTLTCVPTFFPEMRMETFWVEIQSCRMSWFHSICFDECGAWCGYETRMCVRRKVYQWGISFPCSSFNWLLDKFSLRGGKEFLIFSMSSFRLLLPSQILTPLSLLDSQPSESDWTSETWTRIVEVSSLESPKRVLSQVALFSLSPSFLPTFALSPYQQTCYNL